jgi:N-acetylglucosamine kinase-like BadF-type ATPase
VSAERHAVAVDGGNSKTDLALVTRDGRLLSVVRGHTVSHQQVPLPEAISRLRDLVEQARAVADPRLRPPASVGVFCLAGADLPSEVRALRAAITRLGIVERATVLNDGFAPLRAGSSSGWGVVVVCGAGVNCVGLAPDGRTAHFPALGEISGDWGGGPALGLAALGAAIRGRDGRGPRTKLERLVPAHFGLRRPVDVTVHLHTGRLPSDRLAELAPLVFDAARESDAPARAILDRLADELAAMASAMVRRLRLARRPVEVVLSGGVFGSDDATFLDRLDQGIRAHAPHAILRRLEARPVLGAALLALDRMGAPPSAERRLRAAFESGLAG